MVNDQSLTVQVEKTESKEQLLDRVFEGTSKYKTQKYSIRLDGVEIGKIYGQGDNYYASSRIIDYNIGAYFSRISDGENWLVDTHHSLSERAMAIIEFDRIYYIYRGKFLIGEYQYNLVGKDWSATYYPEAINGIIRATWQRFSRKVDAAEFILNSDFAPPKSSLQKYLVSLESETGFNSVKVQADPNAIDWDMWLADYNRATGFENSIIATTEI